MISRELCDDILNVGNDNWTAYQAISGQNVAGSHDFFRFNRQINPIVYDTLQNEARQHIPDFDSHNTVVQLRINRYKVGDWLNRHTDNRMPRTLSVIIQLNEDYEGGDLVMEDGTIAPRAIGTIFTFNPLTYHWVTPVTKGTRYSLIWWFTPKEQQ